MKYFSIFVLLIIVSCGPVSNNKKLTSSLILGGVEYKIKGYSIDTSTVQRMLYFEDNILMIIRNSKDNDSIQTQKAVYFRWDFSTKTLESIDTIKMAKYNFLGSAVRHSIHKIKNSSCYSFATHTQHICTDTNFKYGKPIQFYVFTLCKDEIYRNTLLENMYSNQVNEKTLRPGIVKYKMPVNDFYFKYLSSQNPIEIGLHPRKRKSGFPL